MKRAYIKVMYGRNGAPRIQEEIGDSIKVYSYEEWNKECARRASTPKTEVETPVSDVNAGEKIPKTPKTKAKKPKTKA